MTTGQWKATVERIPPSQPAGVLRVYRPGERPGIDPYCMAATVHWIDDKTVELKGVTVRQAEGENVFVASRQAIVAALRELGVEHVIFIRKRSDGRSFSVGVRTQRQLPKE